MPIDGVSVALPGYPLEILSLLMIADAVGLAALVFFDSAIRHRGRKPR
jgi:hypothetical protein